MAAKVDIIIETSKYFIRKIDGTARVRDAAEIVMHLIVV